MLSQQKWNLNFHAFQPIAHRGNCGKTLVPENTLSAVNEAYKFGISWIECDVKTTSDDILIVIHDDTLRRTTNADEEMADVPVSNLTYNEIVKFDAGCKFSPKFKGEKIPTLLQFLNLIKKLNMGLVLEIKASRGLDIETARKTVELLQECQFIHYPRLLIQSFFVESLREVKRLVPSLNLGLLIDEWCVYTRLNTGTKKYPSLGISICKESVEEILQDLNCTALVSNQHILSSETIANIKKIIPYVLAWTVDTPQKAIELFNSGVDAVISDYPERLIKSFKKNLTHESFFFKSLEKSFLVEYKNNDNRIQHEFDKRYGLTAK